MKRALSPPDPNETQFTSGCLPAPDRSGEIELVVFSNLITMKWFAQKGKCSYVILMFKSYQDLTKKTILSGCLTEHNPIKIVTFNHRSAVRYPPLDALWNRNLFYAHTDYVVSLWNGQLYFLTVWDVWNNFFYLFLILRDSFRVIIRTAGSLGDVPQKYWTMVNTARSIFLWNVT